MMTGKEEYYTASTIETIQKMGQSCKVVLTKLTPTLIDKYTRSHQETEFSEGNNVTNKSRKRKYTQAVHFSHQEYSSSDSKCINKHTMHNFRMMTHNNSKKSIDEERDNINHTQMEISSSNENCTEVDRLQSELHKTLKFPLKQDCSDSCSHKKKRIEFDDHYEDITDANKQTEHENITHSEHPHVSTTINLNRENYESCKVNKAKKNTKNAKHQYRLKSTLERDDDSLKITNRSHTRVLRKLSQKSLKGYNAGLHKTEDTHFPKSLENENNIKNKINNEKLGFKSSDENAGNTNNEVFNKNCNSNIHINKLNSSPNQNHTAYAVTTESRSEICNLNVASGVTNINNRTSCCVTQENTVVNTDRMSLCDEDSIPNISSSKEINNNVTNGSVILNTNKVGKIRVKDPQSLGIQCSMTDNSNHLVTLQTSSLSEQRIQSIDNMSIEELVSNFSNHQFTENDINVFRNYKKNFTDLIESTLPKMGELLHLAVADFVRKDERIQRSKKLSSPDLIKQEKLAAEVEFSDVLQTRGAEFSNLLETIINNFDKDCAEDMILALYCRILDVFLIIDKQNRKHVVRARNVLHKMLHKSNYKNKVVCKILGMKGSDFSQSLSRMSHYVLIYNNLVNAACSNIMSKTQTSVGSNSTAQRSTINENTNMVSTNSTNFSNITEDTVLDICDATSTGVPSKSQHNDRINPPTMVPDQQSSLSTELSNLSISGTLCDSNLNLKRLTFASFSTVLNEQHVTDNHKNNIYSNHCDRARRNEIGINSSTDTHKTQTDVSTNQNSLSINDLQHCAQIENISKLPVTRIPENWKTEVNDLRCVNNGVNYMPLNSSMSRRFTPNTHNFCRSQIHSNLNAYSIRTEKTQLNKLYKQKDVNIQNRENNLLQSADMLQGISSFVGSHQQAARNQPAALPYIYSPGPVLLQKILSNLNTCSEAGSLKKTFQDNFYLSKESVEEARNDNIVMKHLTQHNMRLQSTANNPPRTLDRCRQILPNQCAFNSSNGNGITDINTVLSNRYTQAVMASKNPGKIPLPQIHQVIDLYRMRNYQRINVPINPASVQTVTADKTRCGTQNKLPIISQVFSCRTPASSSDGVVQTQDTVHRNNKNNNNDMTAASFSKTCGLQLPRNVLMHTSNSNYVQSLSTDSKKFQTILESHTNNIDTSQSTAYNDVGHILNHSVSSLLAQGDTNVVTASYSPLHLAGNTVLPAASGNRPVHLSAPVVHHLQRLVPKISQILPVIAGNGLIGATMEFQTLTCMRNGCNQKSKKLCSVCKRVTYCSLECQTEDWYDGHVNVCCPH